MTRTMEHPLLAVNKLGIASERLQQAEMLCQEAKEERRLAVQYAIRRGMSLRKIGKLMDISHARVQQIAGKTARPA